MSSAILMRTRSFLGGSPAAVGDSYSSSEISSLRRCFSARIFPRSRSVVPAAALQFHPKQRKEAHLLRRARSEADINRSARKNYAGLCCPIPSRVEEEEEEEEAERTDLAVTGFDLSVGVWSRTPAVMVVDEEVEYTGGGIGKGTKIGGGGGGGGRGGDDSRENGDQNNNRRIGDYYQKMLKSDPSNPLLLRNYGRFLHDVVGDLKGAEEYYGRSILASPADGEVLSLYAKLLWETRRDEEKAEAYFERAVEASPDDCYVLGSYAQFLWDAEEEEEEEEEGRRAASSPLVEAF